MVYEQVFVAALDCNRIDVANECLHALTAEFPDSLRIYKLQVMKFEAQERSVGLQLFTFKCDWIEVRGSYMNIS